MELYRDEVNESDSFGVCVLTAKREIEVGNVMLSWWKTCLTCHWLVGCGIV